MIDLIYAGWKAAQIWARWNEKSPEEAEDSVEDIRKLREMTKALYEDNHRLIEMAQAQEEQIGLLKRQLGGMFFLFLVVVGAIVWLAVRH